MKKTLAVIVVLAFCIQSVYAGEWLHNGDKWSYRKNDGSMAVSEWITYDTDGDGKEEYYYFDENGNMIFSGKTPDGYDVNENGQWIKDGAVQYKNNSVSKIYQKAYDDTMDAYNKGLDAGQKAVEKGLDAGQVAFEAGLDAGQKAVEAGIDMVGDMYGGILKGAANEYKKEYNNAMNDYKREYNNAMNDYKREINSAMNQYKSALGSFKW